MFALLAYLHRVETGLLRRLQLTYSADSVTLHLHQMRARSTSAVCHPRLQQHQIEQTLIAAVRAHRPTMPTAAADQTVAVPMC